MPLRTKRRLNSRRRRMPFKLRSTQSRTASLLTLNSSSRRDLNWRRRRRQRKRLSEKCNARRRY